MPQEIHIRNVVASAHANSRIPLSRLAMELEGTEYEPEQFPGLVVRLEDPKAAALVFNTGKIVCTGTTSPQAARRAVNILLEKIKGLGVPVAKSANIEVQNVVASADIGKEINLNLVAFGLDNTEYEPESFPGLIYRLDEPAVVFLVFSSGKVVITGAKSREMIQKAVEKLKSKLTKLRALKG